MRNMPKVLNTKKDYFNCLELYQEQAKVELKKLLDERFIWRCDGEIEEGNYPIVDDTHKVYSGEKGELLQYTYVEDENAKIFRLGFTVEEVEELIGE